MQKGMVNDMKTDTIAAIATAMSNSGIGIVRLSGDEAVSIIDKIFVMANHKKLADMPTHTIHYGHIKDGDEIIDEVMVLLMKGPRSYTREDTVEIDCHGGVYVVKRVLETVLKNGARPAEPGEFTKRAFLNGRIDLSQAESVIDIIHSKNEFAFVLSDGVVYFTDEKGKTTWNDIFIVQKLELFPNIDLTENAIYGDIFITKNGQKSDRS